MAIRQPRCFLVYAIAPQNTRPPEANDRFNEYIADPRLPLVLFHDHFLGQQGGIAIFYAETEAERAALADPGPLAGWQISVHPLIYARTPAAFDEQIAYTLHRYRGADWEALQRENRPVYGSPAHESQTGEEVE